MKNMYCPKCDKCVNTEVVAADVTLQVKNREVIARQYSALCPTCGEYIADEAMCKENIDNALEAYRNEENLLSPLEIKEAYSQYELTQSSFAKLLGLGAVTLSRYEHGAVQTKQIDKAIRQAALPENMIEILKDSGHLIPDEQRNRALLLATEKISSVSNQADSLPGDTGNVRVELFESGPSVFNGFRSIDWQRVAQMASYFAEHCTNMGRLKLNKALFYTDFACFASTSCSMSGLTYARATFGPVVDQFDALFGKMVQDGVLTEEPIDFERVDATIYKPALEFDSACFTSDELLILEKVAIFINSFETAKALSDYSHQEKVWAKSEDGYLISYMGAFELNELERFCL